MYLTLLHVHLKIVRMLKFYFMCILPQIKKKRPIIIFQCVTFSKLNLVDTDFSLFNLFNSHFDFEGIIF